MVEPFLLWICEKKNMLQKKVAPEKVYGGVHDHGVLRYQGRKIDNTAMYDEETSSCWPTDPTPKPLLSKPSRFGTRERRLLHTTTKMKY